MICPVCNQTREVIKKCTLCDGSGKGAWRIEQVSVLIPPNSQTGRQITIQGEGENVINKEPGFLRVVLLEK